MRNSICKLILTLHCDKTKSQAIFTFLAIDKSEHDFPKISIQKTRVDQPASEACGVSSALDVENSNSEVDKTTSDRKTTDAWERMNTNFLSRVRARVTYSSCFCFRCLRKTDQQIDLQQLSGEGK